MIRKIVFLIIMAIFLVGCEKQPSVQSPIKIGAILELTGNIPLLGASAKNAAVMAVKEVNDKGGLTFQNKKIPIELIMEDNDATGNGPIIAANKLIYQDKVLAIVGPDTSSRTILAAPIAEKAKIPLITPSSTFSDVTTDPITGKYRKYVFRACFDNAFEVKTLVNFARYTKNYKTAAILYESTSANSVDQANFFRYNFEKLGGKIVAFESYKDTNKDFITQLQIIKAANPDVLFLPDFYSSVALIAMQVKALDIRSELLGSDNWNRPKLSSESMAALEGAYFASHYSPDAHSEVTQNFVKSYQKLYNQIPDDVAALTYDAYQILFKAISASKNLTSTDVRNSLIDLPVMEGVTGTISFEEDFGGNPNKSAVIVQVKNGQFVWVTYANP